MAIEINITPEDINVMLRDAVVKSSIGKLIDDTVKAALSSNRYDNPIEQPIKTMVSEVTRQILAVSYKDRLVTAITAQLATRLTDEWINKKAVYFADQLLKDIKDREY